MERQAKFAEQQGPEIVAPGVNDLVGEHGAAFFGVHVRRSAGRSSVGRRQPIVAAVADRPTTRLDRSTTAESARSTWISSSSSNPRTSRLRSPLPSHGHHAKHEPTKAAGHRPQATQPPRPPAIAGVLPRQLPGELESSASNVRHNGNALDGRGFDAIGSSQRLQLAIASLPVVFSRNGLRPPIALQKRREYVVPGSSVGGSAISVNATASGNGSVRFIPSRPGAYRQQPIGSRPSPGY